MTLLNFDHIGNESVMLSYPPISCTLMYMYSCVRGCLQHDCCRGFGLYVHICISYVCDACIYMLLFRQLYYTSVCYNNCCFVTYNRHIPLSCSLNLATEFIVEYLYVHVAHVYSVSYTVGMYSQKDDMALYT